MTRLSLVLLALATPYMARGIALTTAAHANPIRRVVNLLQKMKAKTEEEAREDEELNRKLACYCTKKDAGLQEELGKASSQDEDDASKLETMEGRQGDSKSNLDRDIKDRESNKKSVKDAQDLAAARIKKYSERIATLTDNIKSCAAAIEALKKGLTAAFLQSDRANILRTFANSNKLDMLDENRQVLLSFLGGSTSGVHGTSEILGILEEMLDEMNRDKASLDGEEAEAKGLTSNLIASLNKQIVAASQRIEKEQTNLGDLGVSIEQIKNDMSDTAKSVAAARKVSKKLNEMCESRKAKYAKIVKERAAELQAIADAIALLNNDDALELFKKTLPNPSSSFIQMTRADIERTERAKSMVEKLKKSKSSHHIGLDLIALALEGKKVSFAPVIQMIDKMVQLLDKEQKDDEKEREFCERQIDEIQDKIKEQTRDVGDAVEKARALTSMKNNLNDQIKELMNEIKEKAQDFQEANAIRGKQNEQYVKEKADMTAAVQLLQKAMNRLQKFFNEKIYVKPTPPPKTFFDHIADNMDSFIELSAHTTLPDAPEDFAYERKSAEHNGVNGLLSVLLGELRAQLTEAETIENSAQKEMVELVNKVNEQKEADEKRLASLQSNLAETEGDLNTVSDNRDVAKKELKAMKDFETETHKDCDWLLENFKERKDARSVESDNLRNAKAVLSGAKGEDFNM